MLIYLFFPVYLVVLLILQIVVKHKSFEDTKFSFFKLLRTVSTGYVLSWFIITSYFIATFYTTMTLQQVQIECTKICRMITFTMSASRYNFKDVVSASKLHLTLYVINFVMMIKTYYKLATSKPSILPVDPNMSLIDSLYVYNCKQCDTKRNPHIHHGQFKCEYLFDHTCPWVLNDIAFNNKGFFYLFLLQLAAHGMLSAYLPYKAIKL